MAILQAFDAAFKRADEKKWDKIYILVDVHGTIFKPSYESEERFEYYPYAKEALQLLSQREDMSLILWTSSYPQEIQRYVDKMKEDGIVFDAINDCPEVLNTNFQCFDAKPYFNVGIDDKFGFDAEQDWLTIFEHFAYFKHENHVFYS